AADRQRAEEVDLWQLAIMIGVGPAPRNRGGVPRAGPDLRLAHNPSAPAARRCPGPAPPDTPRGVLWRSGKNRQVSRRWVIPTRPSGSGPARSHPFARCCLDPPADHSEDGPTSDV